MATGTSVEPDGKVEIVFRLRKWDLEKIDQLRGSLARSLWVRQQLLSYGAMSGGVLPATATTTFLPSQGAQSQAATPDAPLPFHLWVVPREAARFQEWAVLSDIPDHSPHLWCRAALREVFRLSEEEEPEVAEVESPALTTPLSELDRISIGLYLSAEDLLFLDGVRGTLKRSHWLREAGMAALRLGAAPDASLFPGAPPDLQHLSHESNPTRVKVLLSPKDAQILDSIRGSEPRSTAFYRYMMPYLRMAVLLVT